MDTKNNIKTEFPILITGAGSGIGYHITCYLAERGYPVYATARKPQHLEELAKIEHVTPIELDVRDPQLIHKAHNTIIRQGKGLYGLVNNAGVGGLGMFSTWTDEDLYDIFNVNVFGVHRMSNAFLDLLLQAKGRIVNIGSQGGMITSKYYGPYTMTKHALEAYTVALNLELSGYGVSVCIIQPGGIVTNVGENAMQGILERFQRAQLPFKAEADLVLTSFHEPETPPVQDEPESEYNRKPSSPEIVATAVYDALFAEKPKLRYLVGTKWEGDRVIHALIDKLLDENDNPQHNYSRDELVSLLDQHFDKRNH